MRFTQVPAAVLATWALVYADIHLASAFPLAFAVFVPIMLALALVWSKAWGMTRADWRSLSEKRKNLMGILSIVLMFAALLIWYLDWTLSAVVPTVGIGPFGYSYIWMGIITAYIATPTACTFLLRGELK